MKPLKHFPFRFASLAAAVLSLAPLSADASSFTMDQEVTLVAPSSRGSVNTTYFGWDTFNDIGGENQPINDVTPDLGTTAAGVSFVTTNGEDHISSTRNFYIGSGTLAEQVTVATSGTEGVAGTTTIIAQAVTAFGGFPAAITFSAINGVSPTVVQVTNAAGKGQVWAKWDLPGNAASYSFTVTGPSGQSGYSFDKFIVDTEWRTSGAHPDVMRATTPASAHIMSQTSDVVVPSSRGTVKTTHFGWETFNDPGNRTVPINDSTPDLGNTSIAGANFQTTNGQVHALSSGNIYFFAGTLAEQITVPTSGTVGAGFTTIVLQIGSASGFGEFSDTISLSSINGVAPTIVQAVNSNNAGQLWAVWKVPGNEASYTITLAGPASVAHFSFDRVVVDTLWSPNGYLADTMAAAPVSILGESTLVDGLVGQVFNVQLLADGGTAPYGWSLESGDLPPGLQLSVNGDITGVPTASGLSAFTVRAKDANGLSATKAFELTVDAAPEIATASTLPGAVVGVPYTVSLAGTSGTAPYSWSLDSGGLPAGLSFAAGVISGTPTAAGDATFAVKLTDAADHFAIKSFALTVFTSFQPPVMNPISFGSTTVGAAYTHMVSATNYPAGFIITGLPKGLIAAPKTGVISGRPVVTGVFMVQVKAVNKGGSSATVTAPLVVKALPITQTGSFTGIIARDAVANQNLGGCLTLSITSAGTYTGSLKSAGKTYAVKGALNAAAPQVQLTVNGSALSVSLDTLTGALTGTHGAASVQGWRAAWNALHHPASTREGYYSVGLTLGNEDDDGLVNIPQGSGFATVTVTAAGVVTVKGQTADGQAITSACSMGANGELMFYTSLYKHKGSLLGALELAEDPAGLFTDNSISGELTWSKLTNSSKAYATQFGPIPLDVFGKYLATSSKGQIILGLPSTGTADLLFTDGGLAASVTDPDVTGFTYTDTHRVVMPVANLGKVKLSINPNTGAVTGDFTLADTPVRKVKFSGQIVRPESGESKAVGWFLLAQIGGATVLSGGFSIQQ